MDNNNQDRVNELKQKTSLTPEEQAELDHLTHEQVSGTGEQPKNDTQPR